MEKNIKQAVERQGTTVQDIEQAKLFLDRREWQNFVADRPEAYLDHGTRYKTAGTSYQYSLFVPVIDLMHIAKYHHFFPFKLCWN